MSATARKRLLLAVIIVAGFSLAYISAADFKAPAGSQQSQQPGSPTALCEESSLPAADIGSLPSIDNGCPPAGETSADEDDASPDPGQQTPSASPAAVPR